MTDLAALLGESPAWHQRASCRHMDPSDFYRRENEREASWEVRRDFARAHCQQCPVRQECLNAAIGQHEPDGVWGGLEFPTEWRKAMRLSHRARAELAAVVADEHPAANLPLMRDGGDGPGR